MATLILSLVWIIAGILFFFRNYKGVPRKKPVWISVEGIIGAGKSTFIQAILPALRKKYGPKKVLVIDEPVDLWLRTGHLQASHQEPYMAQTYFFHTRIERFLNLYKDNVSVIISERSPMSDAVFWNVTCQERVATPLEKMTYPLLWATWVRMLPISPSLFIYLSPSSVGVAQRRMRERNRSCEQDTVTNTYQHRLKEAHDKVFGGKRVEVGPKLSVRCLHVCSDQNYRDDEGVADAMAQSLLKELNHLN